MALARFFLYSRWWVQLGEIEPLEATYTSELNGIDTLKMSLDRELSKGDRILWTDGHSWFEHVVAETEQEHREGIDFDCECDSSLIADLSRAHIRLFVANETTAEQMLAEILRLTTWEVGECDDFGTGSLTFERVTAYEALMDVSDGFGCEIEPEIIVNASGVERRIVHLRKQRGEFRGARFDYPNDSDMVTKTVLDDEVITAAYGYGKSLRSSTDGVTDRLTFASINDGKLYVEDLEAMELWGIPDGNGGKMHSFGSYENSRCEDEATLLEETNAYLEQHSKPSVSYKVNMPHAQIQGVRLGDTVQVVDRDFSPELRLEARVGRYSANVLEGKTTSATLGTVVSLLPDVYARAYQKGMTYDEAQDAISQSLATKIETKSIETEAVDAETMTSSVLTLKDGDVTARITIDGEGNLVCNGRRLLMEEQDAV